MLYSPKWEQQDLVYQGVSRRAFIAWLETMTGRYDYSDPLRCALGRFTGRWIPISNCRKPDDEGHWLYKIVHPKPHTYEAALERARAVT